MQSEAGGDDNNKIFLATSSTTNTVRRMIEKPVTDVLKYSTVWNKQFFNDSMPFLGNTFLLLSLTLSFHFRFNCSTARSHDRWQYKDAPNQLRMEALPPLGPYYGKDWFIEREGEGAFNPIINRTPAQAAAARLMPKPPNLETYAAALTRDEMDENISMEWGPFVTTDIDRGDWINRMIKDHKLAKHTANGLLLYPSLESHCPRCTQAHDPQHRNFSSETCVVLSDREPLETGGFLPCKYIYCATQPMHARKYCPRINQRCFNCMHRDHAEVDTVCRDVIVNRALFEAPKSL
jgi:hypothetical protein